ncbi:MAG: Na+/H+ antiporter NhaC family protein, partial [Coriobacteriales bacterium]
AFATGTSWGTFGILIPIVLPIFANEPTLLTIGISACLAGAVAGDHCSPISDTTVMASAGANMNHIEHVNTQLPYVLTMAGVSFVCFVIAGFVKSAVICLPIGAVLVIGALLVIKKVCGESVKDIEPAAATE